MSYRIAQDFEYIGKDYWRWSAWIEAEDAELDQVEEVVWILHPSFRRPRRIATERSDKFRLKTAGWGTFLLRAEVVLQDRSRKPLKHYLRLEYPESSETDDSPRSATSSHRPPTIYLSYSTQDSRVAAKVRAGLESAGVEVLDQTRLGPDEPLTEALQRMIVRSEAVVGLVGDDEISPWVDAEIKAALASSKPALVLLTSGASAPGLPDNVHVVSVDPNHLDPKTIYELIRSG
jgi:hypothetical protein